MEILALHVNCSIPMFRSNPDVQESLLLPMPGGDLDIQVNLLLPMSGGDLDIQVSLLRPMSGRDLDVLVNLLQPMSGGDLDVQVSLLLTVVRWRSGRFSASGEPSERAPLQLWFEPAPSRPQAARRPNPVVGWFAEASGADPPGGATGPHGPTAGGADGGVAGGGVGPHGTAPAAEGRALRVAVRGALPQPRLPPHPQPPGPCQSLSSFRDVFNSKPFTLFPSPRTRSRPSTYPQ